MMMFRQTILLVFIWLLGLSVATQASFFEWHVMQTAHYRLYFHPDHKEKAIEALNELELARPFVAKNIGNLPEHMPVVLEAVGQESNGMVRVLPLRMYLFSEYPSDDPFRQSQYFIRLLTTHELVHAAHMTEVSGIPEKLTYWFGDLFYSNIFSPRWYLEGLAVAVESKISPYDGRLNDPYQEAYFAYHAHKKTLQSLGQMSLPMYTYLMGATPYVYGGRFVQYLESKYGNQSTQEFIKSYGQNPVAITSIVSPAFGFEDDFRTTYKRSTRRLYQDWVASEEAAYEHWGIEGKKVSDSGWYKESLIPYKQGVVAYETVIRHPAPFRYNPIHRMVYYTQSGKKKTLFSSSRRLSLRPSLQHDTLFVSRDYIRSGYENSLYKGYGTISEITQINVKSGDKRRRYVGPITAFDVNEFDELFIALRSPGDYTTKLIRVADDEETELIALPLAVSEIRVTDSALYIIAKNVMGPWNLYAIPFTSMLPQRIVESPWAVYGLSVTEGGISFTSNHNKERHTYEWTSQTNSIEKLSSGHDASMGVINNDSLFFVSFSDRGEDIYVSKPKETPIDLSMSYSSLQQAAVASASISSSAVSTSLQSLKNPSLKLFPFLYDEDDLGLIQYSTAYSSFSGFSASAVSHHFRPVSIGLSHYYHKTYGLIQAPLYLSPTHKFLGLSAGLLSDFKDDTYLQFVETSQSRFGDTSILWKKDLEQDKALLSMAGSLYLGDSSMSVAFTSSEGVAFYDMVRGYHSAIVHDSIDQNVRWDAKTKLVDINYGLWIPPVAVGSLFFGVFSDYSSYFDTKAAGAYLSLETKAFLFPLPMVVSIGQSLSEEESRGYMTLEINMTF